MNHIKAPSVMLIVIRSPTFLAVLLLSGVSGAAMSIIALRLGDALGLAFPGNPSSLLTSVASGPHMAAAIAGVAAAVLVQTSRNRPAARETAKVSSARASSLAEDVASFSGAPDRDGGETSSRNLAEGESRMGGQATSSGQSKLISPGASLDGDIQNVFFHAVGCSLLAVLGRGLIGTSQGLPWEAVQPEQIGVESVVAAQWLSSGSGLAAAILALSLISGAAAGT